MTRSANKYPTVPVSAHVETLERRVAEILEGPSADAEADFEVLNGVSQTYSLAAIADALESIASILEVRGSPW